MKLCKRGHWEICYDEYEKGGPAYDCPFCEALKKIEELEQEVKELQAEVDAACLD